METRRGHRRVHEVAGYANLEDLGLHQCVQVSLRLGFGKFSKKLKNRFAARSLVCLSLTISEQQSQLPSDQGMVRRLRRVVEALVLFKSTENEAAQKLVLSVGFCAHRGDDLSGANAVVFC
ncbi:hypothetical protein RHGRI_021142 [Rhododendron griersonianum]|uniref:Uncharacterized protein n=1 Tax=Rhododendron griersonianum TaxID=479676 RepID=A0AAV6JMH2_9ERIC|nr:hypothetical protein RHGRI_021142 [Rhododendron griersonianum]